MKTVLITGVAGFLGSHLAKHHLDAGDDVFGIDSFASSDPNSRHLKALCEHDRFQFNEMDVNELREGESTLDIIYNFACPASPPIYQASPVYTMKTCVVGTMNVLELASKCKNKPVVVHASTSEVYGDPFVSPQSEDYRGCVNSYGPRACYDEGKRAAEALCYDYKNSHGVDARLVRIFNTYGPHMDAHDGRVVSNFIRQALKGEKLTIYGDGSQTRSFCYVSDLINAIVAMGALDKNPERPINIGNPNEFTVNQLAEEVIHTIYGGRSVAWREIVRWFDYKSLPTDDPLQRRPDITRAKEILKWEPKVQLIEGISKTVEYFKSLHI